jgi:hypothetical protein
MEEGMFKPGFVPENAEEIERLAKEAEEALKKYPDSVTTQEKNDGAVKIDESDVNLEETIDEVAKSAEEK